MATEDPVDLDLTMSPSSRKIPALLTKNYAQPWQAESYGEIMRIRVRPTDDDTTYLKGEDRSDYEGINNKPAFFVKEVD